MRSGILENARSGYSACEPLADRPADVVARKIADSKRPHGEAECLQRLVDLLGQSARIEQEVHLPEIGVQHAVADEAVAYAGDHADLLDLLRDAEARGQHVRARSCAPRTISRSLVTLAGLKKCSPTTSPGRRVTAGDLVEVERRGVGGEDGARLGLGVERLEHPPLDLHVLEHRLDHEIRTGDVVVGKRALDEPDPPVELLLASAAPSSACPRSSCERRRAPCRALPDRSRAPSPARRHWRNSWRCRRPWFRRR